MSQDVILGIDLGTTNSVVAVADSEQTRVLTDELGHRLIPSVVSFKADGSILVGEQARERRLIDALNTIYSVKRLIGRPFSSPEVKRAQSRFAFRLVENANGGVVVDVRGETYTLTEISAFVLREVRRVAEARLGHKVNRAVITVPANFNELQRSATKAAGRVAGLEIARIINEPTAAALAYGYGKDRPEKVAVFDLGGGTFDLTLLELEDDVFEVMATAGDSFLGGDDLDLAVAEAMCDATLRAHRWDPRTDEQAHERLKAAAEWVKCQLSTESLVEVTVEELGYGPGGKALDLSFQMTRQELEDRVRPVLGRAFDVCNQALDEAGLKSKEIDNVVLVGGSTRVPLVRDMVREFFRTEPRVDIDPDLVVAQGAAIHGFAIAGKKKGPSALAQVALRQLSLSELQKLKKKREERLKELPKGPAFAPSYQIEDLEMPQMPKAPVSTGGSGLISLELDDPLALGAAKKKPVPMELDDPLAGPAPTPAKAPPVPQAKPAATPPELPRSEWSPEPAPAPVVSSGSITVGESLPAMADEIELESVPPGDIESIAPGELESMALEDGLPSLDPGLPAVLGGEDEPPALPPAPPPAERRVDNTQPFELDMVARESKPEGAVPLDIGGRKSAPRIDHTQPFRTGVDAAPLAPVAPVVAMPDKAPPLLMDVTPHSLGIETAGGFCQHLIRRNAPIPTEQARVFTTASDNQQSVVVRICQGEEREFASNQPLGEIALSGLRSGARGGVQIGVTFIIDASGTLDVRAIDNATGQEQTIRINLLGGADDDEIARMQARQRELMG